MYLDFKTLLIVIVAVRVISAAGLIYVWHINRQYAPARLWAVGCSLVAAGTLLVALRGAIPLELSIPVGNFAVFTGTLVFGGGIVRATGRSVPWRSGCAVVSLAMLGIIWFTFFEPSIFGRSAVFLALAALLDGYAAQATWRSPAGRVGAMQKFVAGLLVLEIGLVAVRLFSTVGYDPSGTLPSNNYQTAFALGIVLVTIMVTLALAFITNLIDIENRERAEAALKSEIGKSKRLTEILNTALSNMSQGLAMYDEDQRLVVCNDNYMKPYGLTKGQTRPGMLLVDIVRLRIANGFYAGSDPEAYIESRIRIAAEMLRVNTDQIARLNDGRVLRVTSHPLESGGWVMTNEDVTEQKRQEAETAYLATHDVLTGLVNRAQFQASIS